MSWDVFICHASEDKDSVARPLAVELRQAGFTVWLDEAELTLGDSLHVKIDEGLARSRYGLVILSQAFFSKHWPRRELNGLAAREEAGRKVILPIWHGVTREEVIAYSPTLADLLAGDTAVGIEELAAQVVRVLRGGKSSDIREKATTTRVMAAAPPASTRRWILVASVIAAAAFVGVLAMWSGLIRSPNPARTAFGAVGQERKLAGRVIDANTLKPIPNAKVSLGARDAPRLLYTDSEGGFTFFVPDSVIITSVLVEHELYESYERRVNMAADSGMEDIRLRQTSTPPK